MLLLSSSPRQSPRRAAAFRPFRHFITDSSAKRWAWERSGIARGSGRFEPKRWERSGTSPVGLVLVSVRSAGTHCAMASYTNPSFIGPEKEKDHPWEGQVKGKKVMINGEWFPVNKLMDYMVNKGHAIGAAFAKLSKKEQADVLAGRSELAQKTTPRNAIISITRWRTSSSRAAVRPGGRCRRTRSAAACPPHLRSPPPVLFLARGPQTPKDRPRPLEPRQLSHPQPRTPVAKEAKVRLASSQTTP